MTEINAFGQASGASRIKGSCTGIFIKIRKCRELVDSDLFRPPHGRITKKQAEILLASGYKIVMWSVLTKDYQQNSNREKLLQNAIRKTERGSIIVFHDSEKAAENMLFILPRFLEYFSGKGYVFKVID
jgi:peptidoglycan/xylan/chitin deacetylase (PgdA/CDA1 family)